MWVVYTFVPLLLCSLIKTGAGGHPCTQCVDRGVRCIVAGSRRRRRRDEQHDTVAQRLSQIEKMIHQSVKTTSVPDDIPEQLTTPTATAPSPTATLQSGLHQGSSHSPERTSSPLKLSSTTHIHSPEQLDIWHPRKQANVAASDVLSQLNTHENNPLDTLGTSWPSQNAVVLDNGATEQQGEFRSTQLGDHVPSTENAGGSTQFAVHNNKACITLETVSIVKQR